MKHTLNSLILFLLVNYSFSQNISLDTTKTYSINAGNFDKEIEHKLKYYEYLIKLKCLSIRNTHVVDSIKAKTQLVIDSSSVYKFYSSDSTWIFLKESYSWNIHNELPEDKFFKTYRLALKDSNKLSEEDNKYLTYMVFYSDAINRENIVDYFKFYQNFKIDSVTYQFVYKCNFKNKKEMITKLIEFNVIK